MEFVHNQGRSANDNMLFCYIMIASLESEEFTHPGNFKKSDATKRPLA